MCMSATEMCKLESTQSSKEYYCCLNSNKLLSSCSRYSHAHECEGDDDEKLSV